MNIWLDPDESQTFRELRLHAPDTERIQLEFQPLNDWETMIQATEQDLCALSDHEQLFSVHFSIG
ncbi:MAG: hypothetical protein IK130_01610 [Oscillospiraceae bacterium]|nr:hypothetical protein [Oscillospiraceae bacterium]